MAFESASDRSHIFFLTFYLAFYLTFYLASSLAFYLTYILTFYLQSGNAHCDLLLADEVRQCPLRFGAGEEEEDDEERRRTALIKSSNRHLAGGET